MKKIVLPLLLMSLLAAPQAVRLMAKDAPATPGIATGMKSVAVVSITNYDELLKDLGFIGEMIGNPGLDQQLDTTLKLFTQGQGLKGLDTSKPWGVVVQTDDVQLVPIIALPVKSLEQLIGVLGPMLGNPTKENGVYKLQPPGSPEVFAAEKNGWAFIAQSADALDKSPTDPARLLALSSQYALAIQLNVQNVPEMYRTMAIDQIKAGFEQGMAQQPGEDETAFAARKKMMEAQMQQMETSIKETKELTLGWQIDTKEKSSLIDVRMSAVPGTKTAAQIAQMKALPSDFAGFIDIDTAATLNFVSKVDTQAVDGQTAQLDAAKVNVLKEIDESDDIPDEGKDAVKSFVTDLFDVFVATLKAGKLDGGANIALGEKDASIIAGAFVADPAKIEASLKKLAAIGSNHPQFPQVKFDAAKHKGVRFHTFVVPVENDDNLKRIFGDTIDISLGFGARHIYLAAGKDSISRVSEAIDKSAASTGKKYPPMRLRLSLGQILKFVASATPDNDAVSQLADELAKSAGKDHLTVQIRPVADDGSIAYRLSVEEGVLKLIGQASQLAGQGGGAPPQGFDQ